MYGINKQLSLYLSTINYVNRIIYEWQVEQSLESPFEFKDNKPWYLKFEKPLKITVKENRTIFNRIIKAPVSRYYYFYILLNMDLVK